MDLHEYVGWALTTESTDFNKIAQRLANPQIIRLLHGVSGLVTEAGELAEFKANWTQAEVEANRVEEFGDLLWYTAVTADELQVFLEDTTVPGQAKIEFFDWPEFQLQLVADVGQMMDVLKRHIFYGADLNKVKLQALVQSVAYWVLMAAEVMGVPGTVVMQKNVDKLKARYKGKFSEELALNRNLLKEKAALEGNA